MVQTIGPVTKLRAVPIPSVLATEAGLVPEGFWPLRKEVGQNHRGGREHAGSPGDRKRHPMFRNIQYLGRLPGAPSDGSWLAIHPVMGQKTQRDDRG